MNSKILNLSACYGLHVTKLLLLRSEQVSFGAGRG